MYSITLEWSIDSQIERKKISLNQIVDLGQHHNAFVTLDDPTVARRQAIIYPDQAGVFLQCISQGVAIGMECGRELKKGDSVQLQEGSSFCCGSTVVRVVSLSAVSAQRNRYWSPEHGHMATFVPARLDLLMQACIFQ